MHSFSVSSAEYGGKLTDEWVFIFPDKKEVRQTPGPVRKAHLAFFFDEHALNYKVPIHHMSANE